MLLDPFMWPEVDWLLADESITVYLVAKLRGKREKRRLTLVGRTTRSVLPGHDAEQPRPRKHLNFGLTQLLGPGSNIVSQHT